MSIVDEVRPTEGNPLLGFYLEALPVFGNLDEVVGRIVDIERIYDFFAIYV